MRTLIIIALVLAIVVLIGLIVAGLGILMPAQPDTIF